MLKPKTILIIIHSNDNYVDAHVSFYREPLNSLIRLYSEYNGNEFKMGFVCD